DAVQQCHVDALAGPAYVAALQRRKNGYRGIHASQYVSDGDRHLHRTAAGSIVAVAIDAHQPAFGLRHEIIPRAPGIGAVESVPGYRAIDDARIDGTYVLVAQTIAREITDLEILHEHIAMP